MSVSVVEPDALQEILEVADAARAGREEAERRRREAKRRALAGSAQSQLRERVRQREELRLARIRAVEAQENRDRETERIRAHEAAERNKERAERRFRAALDLLDNDTGFLADVEQFLGTADMQEQRKREKLHSEWTRKVYEPVQREIRAKTGRVTREELEGRLNVSMQSYLDASNRNALMSLDVGGASGYDPTARMRSHPTYNGRRAVRDDPMKRDLRRIQQEKNIVRQMRSPSASGLLPGPLDPVRTRDTLDVKKWGSLETTTHGRYSKPCAAKPNPGQSHTVSIA